MSQNIPAQLATLNFLFYLPLWGNGFYKGFPSGVHNKKIHLSNKFRHDISLMLTGSWTSDLHPWKGIKTVRILPNFKFPAAILCIIIFFFFLFFFNLLSCHYRARKSFWTCLKTNTGAWRLVSLTSVELIIIIILIILFFFSSVKGESRFTRCYMWACLFMCMLQSKPLNVEYLMMDASVLLPPTGTPLTGIDFVKRLPCGDVEKTRRVCTHTEWSTVNTG